MRSAGIVSILFVAFSCFAAIGPAPSSAHSRQLGQPLTIPAAANESLVIDFQSSGCFRQLHYRLTYFALPQPHLTVKNIASNPSASATEMTVLLAPAQVKGLNQLIRFYEAPHKGGCTTIDTIGLTLLRDGQPVQTETFRDASCLTELLGDAAPEDLQKICPGEVPVLSLSHVIEQTWATQNRRKATFSYKPIPRLQTRAYQQRQFHLADEQNHRQARNIAERLPGYDAMIRRFSLTEAKLGEEIRPLGDLPYSLYIKLRVRHPQILEEAEWYDPIQNGKPRYSGLQFLALRHAVEQKIEPLAWLDDWKRIAPDRKLYSQFVGLTPNTASPEEMQKRVLPAWKHARLDGIPLFEVSGRRGDGTSVTLYLGEKEKKALILWAWPPRNSNKTTSAFWLDTLKLSYHPTQAVPQYVVVAPDGTWQRNTRPK